MMLIIAIDMNLIIYILLGWFLLVLGVFTHMYLDIHARNINMREKFNKLRDTFTEEE